MINNAFLKNIIFLCLCLLISCNSSNENDGKWVKITTSNTGDLIYSYDPKSIVKQADHIEVLLKLGHDAGKDPDFLKKFLESRKENDMPTQGFEHYRYQVQKVYFNCSNGKSAVVGYKLYDDKDQVLETKDFPVEWADYPEASILKISMNEICKRQKQ